MILKQCYCGVDVLLTHTLGRNICIVKCGDRSTNGSKVQFVSPQEQPQAWIRGAVAVGNKVRRRLRKWDGPYSRSEVVSRARGVCVIYRRASCSSQSKVIRKGIAVKLGRGRARHTSPIQPAPSFWGGRRAGDHQVWQKLRAAAAKRHSDEEVQGTAHPTSRGGQRCFLRYWWVARSLSRLVQCAVCIPEEESESCLSHQTAAANEVCGNAGLREKENEKRYTTPAASPVRSKRIFREERETELASHSCLGETSSSFLRFLALPPTLLCQSLSSATSEAGPTDLALSHYTVKEQLLRYIYAGLFVRSSQAAGLWYPLGNA